MKGKVKKLIKHRGYGFISVPSYDDDVFFHSSQLMNAYINTLTEGQDVEFELTETHKGLEAIDVYTIDPVDAVESDEYIDAEV